MKTKLFAIALLAGSSMFAQSRFSVRVGVGDQGYYNPGYGYGYGSGYDQGYDGPNYGRSYGYADRSYNGWGYSPDQEHKHAEKRALKQHQREERWQYGSSEELRDHHRQERYDLKHEQRHERYGDPDAAYGPGHRSAYDRDDDRW